MERDEIVALLCWHKADSVEDIVAAFRALIDNHPSCARYKGEILSTSKRVSVCCRMLRELSDLSLLHFNRTNYIHVWLERVLPCLDITVKDILHHLGDPDASSKRKWETISVGMRRQANVSLADRFDAYGKFLVQVTRLLSRSAKAPFISFARRTC